MLICSSALAPALLAQVPFQVLVVVLVLLVEDSMEVLPLVVAHLPVDLARPPATNVEDQTTLLETVSRITRYR